MTKILELRLCEASRIWLKPNQLYRFTVDPQCANCREAAVKATPLPSGYTCEVAS